MCRRDKTLWKIVPQYRVIMDVGKKAGRWTSWSLDTSWVNIKKAIWLRVTGRQKFRCLGKQWFTVAVGSSDTACCRTTCVTAWSTIWEHVTLQISVIFPYPVSSLTKVCTDVYYRIFPSNLTSKFYPPYLFYPTHNLSWHHFIFRYLLSLSCSFYQDRM